MTLFKNLTLAILIFFSLSCNAENIAIKEVQALEIAGQYTEALEKIKELSNTENDETRYQAIFLQAMIYRKQDLYEKSISTLNFIEKQFFLTEIRKYELYREIGINYRSISKLALAEDFYLKALDSAQSMNKPNLIAQTYNNLGVVADHRNLLAQSMQYHLKAYELLKGTDQYEKQGANFYNLGDISVRLGDKENAEYFFQQALIADKASKELRNVAGTALRLGELKFKNGKADEALLQVNEAIELLRQLDARVSLSRAHRTAALIYITKSELDSALTEALSAIEYATQTSSTLQQFYAFLTELEVRLARAELKEAKTLLPTLDKLIKIEAAEVLQEKYHHLKAQALALDGNFADAYQFMYSAAELQSNIHADYLQKQVSTYKASIDALIQSQELEKAQAKQAITEINLKNAKLSTQMWLVTAIAVFLMGTFFIGFFIAKHRSATLKAKMYQSNIAQKDKMLADISHELRTPLSVLKLHIEAMEHNLIDDSTIAYAKINNKINQLNDLISNVYQLSQADHNALVIHPQLYDAKTVIQSYVYDVERLVTSNKLQFIADIHVDDMDIHIDKPKLDRVIDNLAKNACLYTDVPGKVRFKAVVNKFGFFLQVDDSSPGVLEREQNKLFERLYRVEASRSRATGGSGLGLSICKSIVEAMNGTIRLKSGKFGGLCIQINLPHAVDSNYK
ncbi:sensor histidine kinase [Pseudoalteromonas sp. J010]|uniref:ATP-binding protein n=1 Tax=Pseudoalteromonas sp. J010 TaxID=998465 RepID=UPI000F648395|nr:ATP-binding protein [Pseudoalteromonas sp. J010]RRS09819.1 sensor histidine kinase [Pseudoalteromonas sp. J010]